MSQALFCYGTLLVPEVMQAVTGQRFPGQPARLPGYVCEALQGEAFPGIRPRQDAVTEGRVFTGLGERDLRRLDAYEGKLYLRQSLELMLDNNEIRTAWVYVLAPAQYPRLSGQAWDLAHFRRRHLANYLARLNGH